MLQQICIPVSKGWNERRRPTSTCSHAINSDQKRSFAKEERSSESEIKPWKGAPGSSIAFTVVNAEIEIRRRGDRNWPEIERARTRKAGESVGQLAIVLVFHAAFCGCMGEGGVTVQECLFQPVSPC